MIENLLLIILPASLSSAITYIFTRRKNKAEANTNELQNIEQVARMWRELSVDMEVRLKAEITLLRSENEKNREGIKNLSLENETLKEQLDNLEKHLKLARCENKKMLDELKKVNANYEAIKISE